MPPRARLPRRKKGSRRMNLSPQLLQKLEPHLPLILSVSPLDLQHAQCVGAATKPHGQMPTCPFDRMRLANKVRFCYALLCIFDPSPNAISAIVEPERKVLVVAISRCRSLPANLVGRASRPPERTRLASSSAHTSKEQITALPVCHGHGVTATNAGAARRRRTQRCVVVCG